MNTNSIILMIIVLILVAYLLKLIFDTNKKKEKFNGRYGTMCFKCEDKTLGECMECSDCGYCINQDKSQCLSGNFSGPYDGNVKCQRWIHNDPWSTFQFVNS